METPGSLECGLPPLPSSGSAGSAVSAGSVEPASKTPPPPPLPPRKRIKKKERRRRRSVNAKEKEKKRLQRKRSARRKNMKKRLQLTFSELDDDDMYCLPCPRKGCSHLLKFNGALIKLFPCNNKGKVDWDSCWELNWKRCCT